jgi:CHAD domain-containing protein
VAHRIGRHEPFGEALWRLLRDDVDKARQELAGSGPRWERIHRARLRLKRARSELKVLKPALGSVAGDLKTALASAAKMLGGARDADVAAATARELRAAAADGDAGLDRVVAALEGKAREAHRHDTPSTAMIERLTAVQTQLAAAVTGVDGDKLLARALRRSYEDGRTAMRRARTSMATPDLHAWRKEVKDLWHLIRIARKRLPAKVAAMAGDLARLGDMLGRDHDHAVLAEKLALAPDANHALMRQLALIAAGRRALEKQAFTLGEVLYKRKPKAFAAKARLR